MDVELEIRTREGGRATEYVEVGRGATLTEVVKVARGLLEKCGWERVRVGVGELWSGWIGGDGGLN